MTDLELHSFLDEKYRQYNRPEFIESDPVSVPHLFRRKEDREIAGLFAATLAWGKRSIIIKNANDLMKRMDFSPHDFILNHTRRDLPHFKTFKHRTFNATDLYFFFSSLKNIYRKHKSLEQVFAGEDARMAICGFRSAFFSIPHPRRTEKHVSDPAANSSAKRLNMFLRWMVRKDSGGVDFGIWKNMSSGRLMCPLDVHSGNVARKLGLLHRKQNDWKSVEELTSRLREFDPEDPVKYDFALFGLGVSGQF